jgi:hypothetical protein
MAIYSRTQQIYPGCCGLPLRGHLEALPLPRPNAGYRVQYPTFAGAHSSYRIAPVADFPETPILPLFDDLVCAGQ